MAKATGKVLAGCSKFLLCFVMSYMAVLFLIRLGTWQFLADMPYTCLSGEMMWRLYWYLHSSFMGWADKTHVKDEARQADYEWWLAGKISHSSSNGCHQ